MNTNQTKRFDVEEVHEDRKNRDIEDLQTIFSASHRTLLLKHKLTDEELKWCMSFLGAAPLASICFVDMEWARLVLWIDYGFEIYESFRISEQLLDREILFTRENLYCFNPKGRFKAKQTKNAKVCS